MLRVKLNERNDPDLPRKKEIAKQIEGLCKYLAENRGARIDWADFITLPKLDLEQQPPQCQEYIEIFLDALEEKDNQKLKDLRGAVPEGLVFYLLRRHHQDVKTEVHVRVEKNGEEWQSNTPDRPDCRSLDVAYWSQANRKGRGFECKATVVYPQKCNATVDLLSTIHEKTEGRFEMVLFSFCSYSSAVRNALHMNLMSDDMRGRLGKIQFVGYEHLLDFDGTTACVGGRRVMFGSHDW
jgi:hypothetical protein